MYVAVSLLLEVVLSTYMALLDKVIYGLAHFLPREVSFDE